MITIFVILDSFGSKLFPGKSCKDILAKYKYPASGTYWIKLASKKTSQVYCDMQTRAEAGPWFTATPLQITAVLTQQAMP